MRTQIDWIESIALKQIDDNTAASNGRGLLWLYCNLQTLVLFALFARQCGE